MLTTLTTPYTDTRAGDLAWALGREPLPALACRDLQLGGASVQLRLLGASHQVLLEGDGGSCSETVACMPGSSTPLPAGVSKRIGEWEYEFAARVETLSPGSFAGRAQELLALVSDHPHGLAGTFPGAPNAFTALLVQRHGGHVHWRTWHSYPQEGRLVSTRTRVGAGYAEVVGPANSAAGAGVGAGTEAAGAACALSEGCGDEGRGGGVGDVVGVGRELERLERLERLRRRERPGAPVPRDGRQRFAMA